MYINKSSYLSTSCDDDWHHFSPVNRQTVCVVIQVLISPLFLLVRECLRSDRATRTRVENVRMLLLLKIDR